MKLLKNLFTIFASAAVLSSCEFLNTSESDYYELEELKDEYPQVKKFATNVYSYLRHDFCSVDGAMLDAASDDAMHVHETSNIQYFVNGVWAANKPVDDVFAHYYRGIHDANFFLEYLTGLSFESWKDNVSYEAEMQEYQNLDEELRLLRAYFYFELVRRYQNVPLLKKVFSQSEVNNIAPNTADEVFDFIIKECDELAELLPINYDNFSLKENGRVNRGTALALKSKVALYAASPLFNKTNEKSKWEKAAQYSYELISRAEEFNYKLSDKYDHLFGTENNNDKEVIFFIGTGGSNDFESKNFPYGVIGGNTSTCPSQNLVDAYETVNGYKVTLDENGNWVSNDPEFDANQPYSNRDPRFAATIAYNGMKWPHDKALEIYQGGANAQPLPKATKTGYYLRKYVNKTVKFDPGAPQAKPTHNWVLFRYAEVLLNYAEAMVNAYGDVNYTDATCQMSALEAVNMVRGRKGVDMPALPSMPADQFLVKLKNERRVELAFEGHRFWDIRRWKELDSNKTLYGVEIIKNGNEYVYNKINAYPNRVMEDKMYFYPINNSEIFKNGNLVQNPGWK